MNSLSKRIEAARPGSDEEQDRLEAMVAGRLFGPALAGPARIGRFALLERVGSGGFGVVYAAYDPQLDRRVALKLLRVDAASGRDADSRLLHEARATARLTHANVVSVYEVGEHEGAVYVAMEYIHGETLRTWLATPRSVAQVLAVFVQAGRGLAAAHDAGLVHRDFKPENVLISQHAGDGPRARVVDFGLAGDGTRGPDDTEAGANGRMGTPAYMAPELLGPGYADARSDQYSFCVALHEALAGRHPYAEEGTSVEALRARILTDAPLTGARTIPAWLRRVLRRGSARRPEARFPSMHALLRVLLATPARRTRRALVAAAAGLALASSLATVVGLEGLAGPDCAAVEAELAGVWDAATRDEARARFAASAVVGADEVWTRVEPHVDVYARGWTERRRHVCENGGGAPAEALDLRGRCLARRLAELAGFTGQLRGADAAVIQSAVSAATSLTPLVLCDDVDLLRREAPRPAEAGADERAEALRRELAALSMRVRAGQAQAVGAEGERLTAEARSLGAATVLAEALLLRGQLDDALGSHVSAARHLEEAVLEAIAGRHDRAHAEAAIALVWVQGAQRREEAIAESWVAHAEAALRGYGDDPLLRARLLNHRGVLANLLHDYAGAEAFHAEALRLRSAYLAEDHADVVTSAANVGLALFRQDRLEEARARLEAALAGYRRAFGPHHPGVASLVSNLGQLHIQAGRHDEGLALLREALTLKEAQQGTNHTALISTLSNLGNAYADRGRNAEARGFYLSALAIGERAFGAESPRLGDVLHNLADQALRLGAYDDAVRDARRSLQLQAQQLGADHPMLATTGEIFARALAWSGECSEAEVEAERANARASGLSDPGLRGGVVLTAAWVRHRCGDSAAEVEPLVREATELLGPGGPSAAQARDLLALTGSR